MVKPSTRDLDLKIIALRRHHDAKVVVAILADEGILVSVWRVHDARRRSGIIDRRKKPRPGSGRRAWERGIIRP